MNEKEFFITSFITTFTASYTALNYDANCANGEVEGISEFHILDDAIFLANEAWDKYVEKTRK